MENTLRLMKSILNGKERNTNESELIKEYQESLSPNILAYFYVNNFGLITRISRLYPILTHEDIASFCLQELDKCIQNYDSNLNIKFTTYFSRCFKNKLRMEAEALQTQKRKSILNYTNIDNTTIEPYSQDIELSNIDFILDDYNLSLLEKLQCKLLHYGYSFKEIAGIFKQATITIYKRNEKIKKKILN